MDADHTKLVVAAQHGDEQARDQLIAEYLPLVYNVAGRALSGHADVDDVVQETLLRVLRDLPALRAPESFPVVARGDRSAQDQHLPAATPHRRRPDHGDRGGGPPPRRQRSRG